MLTLFVCYLFQPKDGHRYSIPAADEYFGRSMTHDKQMCYGISQSGFEWWKRSKAKDIHLNELLNELKTTSIVYRIVGYSTH